MISKSILNEIRDRISIVAFIGERIPLKRAGRSFKGRCPFHNEKTPSFNVSDEKQIYHCFGCGEGGDIFDFVMKFDGSSFGESARYLAGIAGVEIPKDETPYDDEQEKAKAKRKRYAYRANEVAKEFFVSQLERNGEAGAVREYLQARGISKEISTQHFLGYADNSWESLTDYLKSKGVPLELAAELGLIRKRDDGGYYDFFRNRLIFPIISPRNEVLGFGGRTLEKGGESNAKYLNSPDSLIYHKSNCIYGLDRAVSSIRNEDSVMLVEGYMDLIALDQAGIGNVVAPLGTALTDGHLRLVGRYTRNLFLLFDGDEAGKRATIRSLELFISFGLMPRVVVLPEGHDPDSMVRSEGKEKFLSRIDAAKSLFEFFVDNTVKGTGLDSAGKVQAIGRIVPFLRMMNDPVERGIYVKTSASRIGVEEGDLLKSLGSKKPVSDRGARSFKPVKNEVKSVCLTSAERTLIGAMLSHPEVVGDVFSEITPESFSDEWCNVAARIIYEASLNDEGLNVGKLLEAVEDDELAGQLRAMTFDGCGCDDEDFEELLNDCIEHVREMPKLKRLEEINEDIRRAEIDGDEKKLFELLKEKRELAVEKHG
ncbi:MAG: DNA primase [Deltaproteobacteria bacterium]|jgi:DNA primase|nr:DNA primase [Deltaproteobacteria bacterium]